MYQHPRQDGDDPNCEKRHSRRRVADARATALVDAQYRLAGGLLNRHFAEQYAERIDPIVVPDPDIRTAVRVAVELVNELGPDIPVGRWVHSLRAALGRGTSTRLADELVLDLAEFVGMPAAGAVVALRVLEHEHARVGIARHVEDFAEAFRGGGDIEALHTMATTIEMALRRALGGAQ